MIDEPRKDFQGDYTVIPGQDRFTVYLHCCQCGEDICRSRRLSMRDQVRLIIAHEEYCRKAVIRDTGSA